VVLNLGSDLSADRLSALVLGLAAISWALGSLISRRLPLPPGLMNPAAQMLCGGLMFAVASRLRGEPWILVPSTEALLAVLYLALFGSVIAYSAYVYLVHNASPVLATSYAYVNPVIAVLLGVAIAGESVSTGSQFAMALVLGGVALIVAFSGSAPKTPNR
jgi:drug/metabolite transporter (DMT)-like permease